MFFVYVLFSEKLHQSYTGQTSDLSERLTQHNLGLSQSTQRGIPRQLVYSEIIATRSEAVQRARYCKTGRGRDELRRLVADTEVSAPQPTRT